MKPVPVRVTSVPTGPLAGETPVITGAGTTVNAVPLVAVPPGVVTWISPEVAPTGTVAVTWVSLTTVKTG